ncbi:unnamed protein product [Medioppia subpectinata]|uniref:Uncharacterized protein n=1 Tax=Medioppia subpectinata TaxID=1979941 RepID=A0A7R9KJK7_9ACAR|nr:unnamed protein product [Medioppia subpectinata]CAG2104875.1 unnamed protein product [Medioppia subpectinata]
MNLNGFNNICADDKYALMKHGVRDLVLIRCLKYYNIEIECFVAEIDHDHSMQFDLDVYQPFGLTNSNNNCIYIYCKDIYY